MYAIVEIGGEQHRVSEGDLIKVEKLDVEVGQRMEFNDILLVAGQGEVAVGRPKIEQAKVIAEVVRQGKGKKIIVFTYRRRKDSSRKLG
ncbi:50S ribosomal protein L21, partial [bacterium]|nr:50S ribosomal protein L21 [bacterium]